MDTHVANAEDKLLHLDLPMWAGLVGVPGVWILQVILSHVVFGQACASNATTVAANSGSMNMAAFLVSSAAIIVGLLCAVLATRGFLLSNMRQIPVSADDGSEAVGILPSGKVSRSRRKRSAALCSAIVGASCAIGLLFTVLAEVFRGSCGL
ncbi:hypothetical protein AWB76_06530 [Caballeronia temeraria]|uniref:Transmembrane protein n=1 Tax=Caballeronia temeraria TaxID=1777137 RepID=A0A158D6E2_9BURK|nr:hypothetical protein [Caballeronia temeraria]SAK90215.1 hypothetical protein AWB76_06530 [Caballeronia temeraria]